MKKPANASPRNQATRFQGKRDHEEIVSEQRWVNQETGEIAVFNVVKRSAANDYGFTKVWLNDLCHILDLVGNGKIKVFSYILANINPISNEFGGSIRELALIVKVDKVTVSNTIQILLKQGFMRKKRSGCYLISANLLVKGDSEKRVGLMVTYDELRKPDEVTVYSGSDI